MVACSYSLIAKFTVYTTSTVLKSPNKLLNILARLLSLTARLLVLTTRLVSLIAKLLNLIYGLLNITTVDYYISDTFSIPFHSTIYQLLNNLFHI